MMVMLLVEEETFLYVFPNMSHLRFRVRLNTMKQDSYLILTRLEEHGPQMIPLLSI
jgi:hypothetical protein